MKNLEIKPQDVKPVDTSIGITIHELFNQLTPILGTKCLLATISTKE